MTGIKIAVTGPESTGKTTLCLQLAELFSGRFVPEAAREYLGSINRPYKKEDVEEIARRQIKLESEAESENMPWIFCDTNLLVIKIWMEVKYGACPPWIVLEMERRSYDLEILMKPDIGWTYDPFRENPADQWLHYEFFRNELLAGNRPWIEVSGSGPARLENALEGIQRTLKTKLPVL